MCKLFGFATNNPAEVDWEAMEHLMSICGESNRDASGLALVAGGGYRRVIKSPGHIAQALPQYREGWEQAQQAKWVIGVGHTRNSTHGDPKDNANNHPFVIDGGRFVGAVTGVISNHTALRKALPADVAFGGECDSESLLAYLWHVGGKSRSVADLLAPAEAAQGWYSCVLWHYQTPRRVALVAGSEKLAVVGYGKGTVVWATSWEDLHAAFGYTGLMTRYIPSGNFLTVNTKYPLLVMRQEFSEAPQPKAGYNRTDYNKWASYSSDDGGAYRYAGLWDEDDDEGDHHDPSAWWNKGRTVYPSASANRKALEAPTPIYTPMTRSWSEELADERREKMTAAEKKELIGEHNIDIDEYGVCPDCEAETKITLNTRCCTTCGGPFCDECAVKHRQCATCFVIQTNTYTRKKEQEQTIRARNLMALREGYIQAKDSQDLRESRVAVRVGADSAAK